MNHYRIEDAPTWVHVLFEDSNYFYKIEEFDVSYTRGAIYYCYLLEREGSIFHNNNGPALIYLDGSGLQVYYLNDHPIARDEFWKMKAQAELLAELDRI